jgi:hydrogenase expression/formation protein HypE
MSKRINRAHGGGGSQMRQLIGELFLSRFSNPHLDELNDFARLNLPPGEVALTTDSFVVDPWTFPGGNIGDLAICGTVNDLAMAGATPLYLTAGFILPEGLEYGQLTEIVDAMAARAKEAGVTIVTGDTKVVEAGSGPFINTAGVGIIRANTSISGHNARPGDAVLVTGVVGSHGIAVLSQREGIGFATDVMSDVAPLGGLVGELLDAGIELHTLRDPTRGGVAEALNEIATQSGVEIEIDDSAIPMERGVTSACELLGYDPLHIANEGCALVVLPQEAAERALEILHSNDHGKRAAIIGKVSEGGEATRGRVTARTVLGSRRLVDPPSGELLPRIC